MTMYKENNQGGETSLKWDNITVDVKVISRFFEVCTEEKRFK